MEQSTPDHPTLEQWQSLFSATARFKELAPWQWMHESHLFGVQIPGSELVYYCQVLGGMGEHFALSAYRDGPGLSSLWQMVTRPLDGPELEPIEILGTQDCLMASFEDRGLLDRHDMEPIKKLGLKYRGRNAWPQFRSYQPYTVPWHLTSEEARHLILCLEQSMVIAERLRQDPALIGELEPEGPYLVRTPIETKAGLQWEDRRKEVLLPPVGGVSFAVPDDDYYEELFEVAEPSNDVLELDYLVMPEGIQEVSGGRPFYPFLVIAAEPRAGVIVNHKLVPHAEVGAAIVDLFFETIETLKRIPKCVQAQHPLTLGILEVIAGPMQIDVRETNRLRVLEAFEQEFMGVGGGF